MTNKSEKFDNFVKELKELCIKHNVNMSGLGRDDGSSKLAVWDLLKGESPIHSSNILNQTGF